MRGQVREWWGKLTDDDLKHVGGKADQLVALRQQEYGYSRERAEQEFDHCPPTRGGEPVKAWLAVAGDGIGPTHVGVNRCLTVRLPKEVVPLGADLLSSSGSV